MRPACFQSVTLLIAAPTPLYDESEIVTRVSIVPYVHSTLVKFSFGFSFEFFAPSRVENRYAAAGRAMDFRLTRVNYFFYFFSSKIPPETVNLRGVARVRLRFYGFNDMCNRKRKKKTIDKKTYRVYNSMTVFRFGLL